jgi:hypothetical protein
MPLIPCRNKTNCTIIRRFLTWGLVEVNGVGMMKVAGRRRQLVIFITHSFG